MIISSSIKLEVGKEIHTLGIMSEKKHQGVRREVLLKGEIHMFVVRVATFEEFKAYNENERGCTGVKHSPKYPYYYEVQMD